MSLPISILIYHGEKQWEKEYLKDHFGSVPEEMQAFLPNFDYLLLNTHDLSYEQILGLGRMYLPNILLALKFGRNPEKVLQYFEKIVIFAKGKDKKEMALNFFQATIIYLNNINIITRNNMTYLIEKLPPAEKINGKTTYEQFVEQGIEQGIGLGIEQGIEKIISSILLKHPEFSDTEIADLCSVDVQVVIEVRRKLQASV